MKAADTVFLVNPAAGNGKGAAIWKKTEKVLVEKNIRYSGILSRSASHLKEVVGGLAKETAPGEKLRLIVIGGDGTLSQVVNRFTDLTGLRLGYMPAGSANDFARDLKLPKDPLANLQVILADHIVRSLDVGTLSYHDISSEKHAHVETKHRFIVSAGIGFDAAVCEGVDRSKVKKALGKIGLAKLSYLFIALKIIFSTKKTACTLILDDEKTIPLTSTMFVAAMIHGYEGGGFHFAPRSDASDGIFDLCIAGDISVPKFLFALPKAMRGTHFGVKGVDHALASKIELRTEQPLWVHTDGEVSCKSGHITMRCEKSVLEMLN